MAIKKSDVMMKEVSAFAQDVSFDYIADEQTIHTFYKNNPMQFELILATALEAVNSARAQLIFTFYPDILKRIAAMKKIDIIPFMVQLNMNLDEITAKISTASTEMEIYTNLGQCVYVFIKYIILTTNQYFIPTTHLMPIQIDEYKVTQFKMIHSQTSEAALHGKETRILFHGSGFDNWYNILRTGLKVPYGDSAKLLVNANAYGCGIYASDSAQFSLGYCRNHTSRTSQMIILAVCEVIAAAAVEKTRNIFLITDESAILLRYLMYFDVRITAVDAFTKQLEKIAQRIQGVIATRNAKIQSRLTREFAQLADMPGIVIERSPDMMVCRIKYTDFGVCDTPIVHQLRANAIPHIEIEFMFGKQYPFTPPFIRLVFPRIVYYKSDIVEQDMHHPDDIKIIDNGGGICTILFKNGEWRPTLNMYSLIIYLHSAIFANDELRLGVNWHIPFEHIDALTAFDRTISTFNIKDALDIMA